MSYHGILASSDKPNKYMGQNYCYLVLINPILVRLLYVNPTMSEGENYSSVGWRIDELLSISENHADGVSYNLSNWASGALGCTGK